MIKYLAAIGAALILTVTGADARTTEIFDRHAVSGSYNYGPVIASPRTERMKQKRQKKQIKTAKRVRITHRGEVQLLPHPVGCPPRSFCGCGAALEVFGRHVRDLWLARNWFRFPAAEPAPGNVAVRRHHVYVIRKVLGPGKVLAYDANSGGRKTRLWVRSLAGYRVVNPHGSKYATAG